MSLPIDPSSQPTESRPVSSSNLETVLVGLRAAAEGTRLRIVALLAEGELTVSELCKILGQTQPRVSRHLKLLCDAGLLDRHSEGTSAFYSPSRREPGRSIFDSVLTLVDHNDATLAADRQRLIRIRGERAQAAGRYFEEIAGLWDGIRSLHVDDADVEQALLAATRDLQAEGSRISTLLDIGTGTGRILELFADRVDRGLGIDLSSAMLNLARSNLTAKGFHHCSVRQGNVYALEVPADSVDLAILHHVLHFLDDPASAIGAAAETLRPGGQLIIVDFAPHQLETLRNEHAHRRLGFDDHEVSAWCADAGLVDASATHLVPPTDLRGSELLTVTLWTAFRGAESNRSDQDRNDQTLLAVGESAAQQDPQ